MNSTVKLLRRFTDLPALLTLLRNREITLLAPSSWDDRNDQHLMDAYKRSKKLKTLLALCFSEVGETYHHWKVFAPGNAGVCVEFNKLALLNSLPTLGIKHAPVSYKTISQIKSSKIKVEDLPFTKRAAFRDEKEYRIIFTSARQELESKSIPIDLSTITRIAINPWMHPALFQAVKDTIYSITNTATPEIFHSKLIESPTWKQIAREYA